MSRVNEPLNDNARAALAREVPREAIKTRSQAGHTHLSAPADFIENPPNFQGRPCVPPPSSRPACAMPHCTQRVEEPGDTFCARCVADYEIAESHEVGCPCGPCGVHAVVTSVVWFAASLPEVKRYRAARRTSESLAAYLARRDGGAR